MRVRMFRGTRLAGVPFADRTAQGLVAGTAGLTRRVRMPARHLPVVIALPLAAVTLAPGHEGSGSFAEQGARALVDQDARGPLAGRGARVTPAVQKPQAPPREVHPEAREAISKILSPFCPPPYLLENCPSPGAAALRDSINAMAHSGMTADSIIERVLAAYGEEYRGMPKSSGRGLLAWAIPPVVLVAGLALVVLVLRRLKGPAPVDAPADLTDEDRERLDAALAELEEMEESE